LRVGIDYTSAVYQGAGIGRLTRNVVQALARIDRENEYTLLIQGREIPYPPSLPDDGAPSPEANGRNPASGIRNANWREVRTWLDQRWWTRIWHRARLPLPVEWLIGNVDLFHGPDFSLPPLKSSTRAIVTVHDLSYLRLPHCFEPALLDYLVGAVQRAANRADWVLADSESTRRDVIELLAVPEERTSALYPGVEPRFNPHQESDNLERVRSKYQLPDRFILSVGTVQPRKNYERLVEAFVQMEIDELSLVIVGGKGWLYQSLLDRIETLNLGARVLLTGYIDDIDLPAIYASALAFALPSLYEGFGIPALEAMACGIPVVTADNSSLPEVVGDAGLLVNAQDTPALADALTRALTDTELRHTMVNRGLAQASRFTWEKAAVTLRDTYVRLGS
jgi:glycosyltransferase involved in cell wall biosynthesis